LIGRCLNVKVADFGLSRVMQLGRDDSDAYYRIKTRQPMPLRWMAPSTIVDRKFTSESDVWSYGCLLCEMWSAGEMPFNDLDDQQVVERLLAAYAGRVPENEPVLASPKSCPPLIDALIQSCLTVNGELRPNFIVLRR
ncbi:uncharacterized protein MONBRDRAFT_1858, partial [Monosiga brevicollis MX1]